MRGRGCLLDSLRNWKMSEKPGLDRVNKICTDNSKFDKRCNEIES